MSWISHSEHGIISLDYVWKIWRPNVRTIRLELKEENEFLIFYFPCKEDCNDYYEKILKLLDISLFWDD